MILWTQLFGVMRQNTGRGSMGALFMACVIKAINFFFSYEHGKAINPRGGRSGEIDSVSSAGCLFWILVLSHRCTDTHSETQQSCDAPKMTFCGCGAVTEDGDSVWREKKAQLSSLERTCCWWRWKKRRKFDDSDLADPWASLIVVIATVYVTVACGASQRYTVDTVLYRKSTFKKKTTLGLFWIICFKLASGAK